MRKALPVTGAVLLLSLFGFHAGITAYNRITDDPHLNLPAHADAVYTYSTDWRKTHALWNALFKAGENSDIGEEFSAIEKRVPSEFIGKKEEVSPEAVEEAWEKADIIRRHVDRLASSDRIESPPDITMFPSIDIKRRILLTNLYLLHAAVLKAGGGNYLPVLDRITRLYYNQFRGATNGDDMAGSFLFLQYIHDRFGDDLHAHAPDT